MSRLHRQKLRALARAGDTPANRAFTRGDVVAERADAALTNPPDAVGTVKPSRAKRPRRKAVRKSKSKARKHR